jgi:hypothetical protein
MIQRSELSFEKMKRSIVIAGHKTSLSLEAAFWLSLKEIAALEKRQLVNWSIVSTRVVTTQTYLRRSGFMCWTTIVGWRRRRRSRRQTRMTDDDKPPVKLYGVYARLHAPPNKVAEAVADHKARQDAERTKTAKLRALRLFAKTKAANESKKKQMPANNTKR